MSNFQDISMQWLHFVNELDCYKSKENKKQLLNIIQVLCSHNIVTLKDIRYSIRKIIIAILTTLFTLGGVHWVGVQLKTNHTCLKSTYKTRNIHGFLDFIYLDLHIKSGKNWPYKIGSVCHFVHLSICPGIGIVSLVLSKFWHGVRNLYEVVRDSKIL